MLTTTPGVPEDHVAPSSVDLEVTIGPLVASIEYMFQLPSTGLTLRVGLWCSGGKMSCLRVYGPAGLVATACATWLWVPHPPSPHRLSPLFAHPISEGHGKGGKNRGGGQHIMS